MMFGAERRLENRLKKLEAMMRDPKSVLNLETMLVSLEQHIALCGRLCLTESIY